jgi:hypothetical protein
MRFKHSVLGVLAFVLLAAETVHAVPVLYEYSAPVVFESRNGAPATPDQRFFTNLDTITGSFVYENDLSRIPEIDAGTFYDGALTDLTGTVAGNSFSDPFGTAFVGDDPSGDAVLLFADTPFFADTSLSIINLSGFQIVNGSTTFELVNVILFWGAGTSSDFLSDESLPTSLPPVGAANNGLLLAFRDTVNQDNEHTVTASILTVTPIRVVPIPAAVWLFGSGLGLLGWLRRKQTS